MRVRELQIRLIILFVIITLVLSTMAPALHHGSDQDKKIPVFFRSIHTPRIHQRIEKIKNLLHTSIHYDYEPESGGHKDPHLMKGTTEHESLEVWYEKHLENKKRFINIIDAFDQPLPCGSSGKPDFSLGKTWYVDDDGGADFTRIEDAVLAADHGDTIVVHSGFYQENLIIDKSIHLLGENKHSTIIDGGDTNGVIIIKADWATIAQFTIQNGGLWTDGILINSHNNTIVDNEIKENRNCGILLLGSHHNTIMRNTIVENGDNGIEIINAHDNTLTDNFIESNAYGFLIQGSNNNSILSNEINSHLYFGIGFFYGSNTSIVGNVITNSSWHGIGLNYVENTLIKNNHIKENNYGIHLENSHQCEIIENDFFSNGIRFYGPNIKYWSSNIIEGNTVNNKPLIYYKDMNNQNIQKDAGQIILVNCSHFSILNQDISNASDGVTLGFCSNITILDSSFKENLYGILIHYSSHITILNITCKNNHIGIYVYQSNVVHALHNHVISNGNYGILYSLTLGENQIKENIVQNNHGTGIYLRDFYGNNSININMVMGNGLEGIKLLGTKNSIIQNNIINNNNLTGLFLSGNSNDNIIQHNQISNNNLNGIYLEYHCSENLFINNTCTRNHVDGIGITDGSDHNVIQQNICSENMKGIAVRESIKNTVINNNCTMNHQGILLNLVNEIRVQKNTCSRNGIGIYLYNSSACRIQKNQMDYNSFKGLIIRQNSTENTISNNQIGPWNYQGIYIEKSTNNYLHHNQIINNNDDGIGLVQTHDNIIQENNFIGNTNYAVEGLLCFDNAQMNYWGGHRFPYLQADILTAGYLNVHPILKKPVEINRTVDGEMNHDLSQKNNI